MAPRKPNLSVVAPDAPRPAARPATVKAAAQLTERDLLVALRDNIAGEIDKGVPPHALAPLARQLRDIDKEIRALDAETQGDEVGDAAATPDEEWIAT